ncbi:hypothetical protein BDY21DRAFT_338301 [Lineolata rhizophorae]|uniref:Uncharacterized protein n=1 Tax=Lineolata rhizophorae TaxID=578093 RepID=A0A6A6P6I6_9PEZI|nr:hypothetical protein BDY21DRAFT_338301 [Lineolata rhizophorae]
MGLPTPLCPRPSATTHPPKRDLPGYRLRPPARSPTRPCHSLTHPPRTTATPPSLFTFPGESTQARTQKVDFLPFPRRQFVDIRLLQSRLACLHSAVATRGAKNASAAYRVFQGHENRANA